MILAVSIAVQLLNAYSPISASVMFTFFSAAQLLKAYKPMSAFVIFTVSSAVL